jgi:hypothetical protein
MKARNVVSSRVPRNHSRKAGSVSSLVDVCRCFGIGAHLPNYSVSPEAASPFEIFVPIYHTAQHTSADHNHDQIFLK